jgi:hypothetical protein
MYTSFEKYLQRANYVRRRAVLGHCRVWSSQRARSSREAVDDRVGVCVHLRAGAWVLVIVVNLHGSANRSLS